MKQQVLIKFLFQANSSDRVAKIIANRELSTRTEQHRRKNGYQRFSSDDKERSDTIKLSKKVFSPCSTVLNTMSFFWTDIL